MKKIFIAISILYFCISNISAQKSNRIKFDALSRIEKVINADSSTLNYQYDEVGNRIGMIVTKNQANSISKNISQLKVQLYPNPASESFCISGFEDIASLRITDISGKVILVNQIQSQEDISISSLLPGLYIIKLITKDAVIEKKLLKK